VSRFQRLALATVAATLVLVTIGVLVRATGSGMACPNWPGCFAGQFLPGLDAGFQVWAEWIHRTVAALIGFLILGMAAVAIIDHRDRPSILWPSIAAVLLVGFQAWLGRETVRLNNSGPSVTAHLAAAMALVGLLVYLFVRSRFPARGSGGRGGSQRFTLLAVFSAAAVYLLLLFGSNVTALNAGLVFVDWPLMNGSIYPIDASTAPDVAVLWGAHAIHRYVAVAVFLVLLATWLGARRLRPANRSLVAQALGVFILYVLQVVVGGLQVLTQLADWTQTLHVALGALIWGGSVALATSAYYTARLGIVPPPAAAGGGSGADGERAPGGGSSTGGGMPGSAGGNGSAMAALGMTPAYLPAIGPVAVAPALGRATAVPAGLGATIRAYVALTKPRIIELLLITTVPAMVLATRDVPGIRLGDWLWTTVWTLVGGTLAAGAANAINQYLERDIDERMARTRRRPLPAHAVEPERAVIFGIVLAAVSLAIMVWFVNLLSAFLTLLAIGFYVVVYTMLLKRTTPQNIVIGGAAGALPPVIGWAAVTGNIGLPAVMLFLLVFYWTPPHFWALALRIRADYAAAGVPMLPVVRGVAETSRQIGLYTILLVALSLVFVVVGQMGAIYLVAAVVLGAIFLWRAWVLWQQGSAPEASTAQAIRLYRWSISYLTLLFVAVAIDALVAIPVV
jgi:protoheme IX farnesyltransferase